MAEQLSFELPSKTARGREDFFVSPSNAMAVALLSASTWPGGKLVLSGPEGSGKTHLLHVWAAETGAQIVSATALASQDLLQLSDGPVAVEDLPRIATDTGAQDAMFHLHNLTLANGQPLLMTGRGAPPFWALSLPDLQSRVQGAQHVALEPPDDELLGAVIAKLFFDRQLNPRPDLIRYLVRHMDRRFDAAARMVDRLDHIALTEKREITRALAARLMAEDADLATAGN
ncbi:chromosomal replication initiator DnaA [Ruegeria sp. 2205SS24-7]|uniref:chromosomal replication initiator DnaA n=1 Tax=Ruegeria discodermiae TaxID=3064389 RepID=UPI0027419B42|nr:chromosomal replication initiator DnaA [Ruegeria sp. 2205SS24-7]MDP5217887.1 chromosomal replication initiator DnaA [Ruegeria sp. 2205SS24-7]